MELTEQQHERLFKTFVNMIIDKCANEIGITKTELRMRYMDDKVVKETLDGIIKRHIKSL